MKKLLFSFSLLVCLHSYAQEAKDTTFSVRGFTCTCKYAAANDEEKKPFSKSEAEAYYPGGEKEWKKYLKKYLYTGFQGKKHEFKVQFTVSKEGILSDYKLLDKAVNQKYEEAVRVLTQSGKWFPSIQDGLCVTSNKILLFEF